jgi:predicted HTH domain antitoxin
MDSIRVEVEVSRDLLDLLNVPETALGPRLKQLVAMEFCREGEVSPRRAAELLGLPKSELIELLDRRDIDYATGVPEETAAQVEEVWEKLKRQSS